MDNVLILLLFTIVVLLAMNVICLDRIRRVISKSTTALDNEVTENRERTIENTLISTNEVSDPIYQAVEKYVSNLGSVSTSVLQRKFNIGYARAARLVDLLYTKGIIGPQVGAGRRKTL